MKGDPFPLFCQAHGLPLPQGEYRFLRTRRWRFDWAWVEALVAIEVEGGIWTRGRHTRGTGYLHDMAKYNAAQLSGWMVLRYTPQQLYGPAVVETLHTVLDRGSLACRRAI